MHMAMRFKLLNNGNNDNNNNDNDNIDINIIDTNKDQNKCYVNYNSSNSSNNNINGDHNGSNNMRSDNNNNKDNNCNNENNIENKIMTSAVSPLSLSLLTTQSKSDVIELCVETTVVLTAGTLFFCLSYFDLSLFIFYF